MKFESFRQDCLVAWNNYLHRIYSSVTNVKQDDELIFPTHILFSDFGKYYGLELLGVNSRPVKLRAKTVKYDNLSAYFDLFHLGNKTPMFHYSDTWFHHRHISNLSLGHPVDLEAAKQRFPLFGRHQSGLVGTAGDGSLMSFGDQFGGGSWIDCSLTSCNNGYVRSKDILYFSAFPASITTEKLEKTLATELNLKSGEGIVGVRLAPKDDCFPMSIAPLQNLYLTKGVHETTITDFLESHPQIIKRAFGAENTIYQPRLIWAANSIEEKPELLIPDLLWQREDGFYNILDFKLAKPNKFRLTKANRRRRRFVDYVNDGIAQLAHYSEYFEHEANKKYAKEKYGIITNEPQLVLVIGNSENMHANEVRESLRPFNNERIQIIDYDTFISLYIQASRI